MRFHSSELNYCELNSGTCLHDGKCTSIIKGDGSFKCECPSGFRGRNCEIVPQIFTTVNITTSARPNKTSSPTMPIPHNVNNGTISTSAENNNNENKNYKPSVEDEIDNEA